MRLGLLLALLFTACTPIPPRSAMRAEASSPAPPPSDDSFVVDIDADGVSIGGSPIPLDGLESTVRANRGARLVVLRGGPTLAWERVVTVLDALHVLLADRFALELAQKSADRVELSLPKADPASAPTQRLEGSSRRECRTGPSSSSRPTGAPPSSASSVSPERCTISGPWPSASRHPHRTNAAERRGVHCVSSTLSPGVSSRTFVRIGEIDALMVERRSRVACRGGARAPSLWLRQRTERAVDAARGRRSVDGGWQG